MGLTWRESDLIQAVRTYRTRPHLKLSYLARVYHIPRTTLFNRLHGKPSRQETRPNSQKLTSLEESVIVRHILDLDSRSFPPRKSCVEDMANRILTDRNARRVGKNWTSNFVRRQPDLRTRFNRAIDYQRVLSEDPDAYNAWFRLVRNTIDKYGIQEEDIYNFDETGFVMGQISSEMVVTSSERQNRPRTTQQGNREWVTVIQGVSSYGYTLPPYIIVAGKNHLSSWSENSPLPHNWVIAVTSNGWTTNERGLDWIQHFNQYTTSRTTGRYRLLVLDGHESHHSTDFELYCKENNIITLCMPPHSSHKLQPLDVGCFRPLKRSYGAEIEKLMRSSITHISKEDFFVAFYNAFRTAMTESNIRGGFRGSGLVPYDPDSVISQLDVVISTSRPSTTAGLPSPWEPSTPQNLVQTDSQSLYVRERIVQHQNSSPTTILQGFDQFAKGAKRAIHELALLRAENTALRTANHELSRRRRTKKRRLQEGGSLTIEDAQALRDCTNPRSQLQVLTEQSSDRTSLSPKPRRRCTKCGEHGHNIRTCSNREEIAKDSDSE
jgi:DDE superfamily endonuclease/Tc5 transposase DNA-binding domain